MMTLIKFAQTSLLGCCCYYFKTLAHNNPQSLYDPELRKSTRSFYSPAAAAAAVASISPWPSTIISIKKNRQWHFTPCQNWSKKINKNKKINVAKSGWLVDKVGQVTNHERPRFTLTVKDDPRAWSWLITTVHAPGLVMWIIVEWADTW